MNPISQYQTLFQQLNSKKNNQVSIQVKKGQCLKWSDDIEFCVETWVDRRCRKDSKYEVQCFWEGDFEIGLIVYQDKKKLTAVKLNDHDLKYGPEKWYKIKLINGIQTLNIAGGPKFATGFTDTNNLVFHFSAYIET